MTTTLSFGQLPQLPGVSSKIEITPDSTGASFDQVIAAQTKGDKAATVQALETSTATLESEAKKAKAASRTNWRARPGI